MKKMLVLFTLFVIKGYGQTIESYLSAPFPTELTSSIDGKAIAWVFNDKGSRNVYVAEAPAFNAKK